MRKVVCAACGLVNLESFPSFPLCAGCGARLPQRKRRPWHNFFQQPVKTLVWAFSVAASVAVLALLSISIARETRLRDRGPLMVASSLAPDIQSSGADLILQLRVTSSDPSDHEPIRNLRLRLSQKEAQEAKVQIASPPASIEVLGGGQYFVWKAFSPGQTITMRLRPRHILALDLVANGFSPFQLEISPAPS